jgi:hypothetical protein
MKFNFERLHELCSYFQDNDCSYHELMELRDKLRDFEEIVEFTLDKYEVEEI